jgi:hypothetical protein
MQSQLGIARVCDVDDRLDKSTPRVDLDVGGTRCGLAPRLTKERGSILPHAEQGGIELDPVTTVLHDSDLFGSLKGTVV